MSTFINPEEGDGDVFKDGVAGGQKIQGGTGAGETLQLESTANASKGEVEVLDEFHFHKKGDIGVPGAFTGLDIGEGGSYDTFIDGVEICEYWAYDDSAVSGSKFSRFASNAGTQLSAINDAIVIGSKFKFCGARLAVDVLMNPGAFKTTVQYWNGSAWVTTTSACYEKDVFIERQNLHFRDVETQYVEISRDAGVLMDSDNNILDEIPDTDAGIAFYWIRFQNTGLLTTPMQFSEGKVRGDDLDIAGSARALLWGLFRRPDMIFSGLGGFNSTTNAPQSQDVDISTNISLDGNKNQFNDGVTRQLTFQSMIPIWACTASPAKLKVFGQPQSTNTGDIDMRLRVSGWSDGDVVDGTIPEVETTVSIAANGVIDKQQTLSYDLDIESFVLGSNIVVQFARLGGTDGFTGDFKTLGAALEYQRKFLA